MGRLKEQFKLAEFFKYFIRVFRKPKEGEPQSFNLRTMHTINKISILMFLFALVVMIYRALTR